MHPNQYTLTPRDIYRYAVVVLQPHLKWRDQGPKCTVTTVLQILFYAVAQLCSVFAACHRLRGESSPGEFHPKALAKPEVTLSSHPAPITQPGTLRQSANARTTRSGGEPPFRATRWPVGES